MMTCFSRGYDGRSRGWIANGRKLEQDFIQPGEYQIVATEIAIQLVTGA